MKVLMKSLLGAVALASFSLPAYADTTLTIATVNNGDMIRMQRLTDDFTKANPDIKLNWVTLEENVLRQKVTTDIATKAGQFDILTIGTYEVPIWAKKGWLVALDKLGADYDVDDLLPPIRAGLSFDGKLYAAPFYGESSFTMYRKDLMEKAGLKMPENPTWDFIRKAADKMTDKAAGVYGICLRGKAGLGREHGVPDRHVQLVRRALVRREVAAAVQHAGVEEDAGLLCDADEGGRSSRAHRRTASTRTSPCSTPASAACGSTPRSRPASSPIRSSPRSPTRSASRWRRTTARARTPTGCGRGRSPSRPASSKADAAEKFISWATSKHYTELVASKDGWARVPPGTRTSLYKNPDYLKAAPWAELTLKSINSADPTIRP